MRSKCRSDETHMRALLISPMEGTQTVAAKGLRRFQSSHQPLKVAP